MEPTNVRLTVASNTTLLVQFDEPECHNDALVTRYKGNITIWKNPSKGASQKLLRSELFLTNHPTFVLA